MKRNAGFLRNVALLLFAAILIPVLTVSAVGSTKYDYSYPSANAVAEIYPEEFVAAHLPELELSEAEIAFLNAAVAQYIKEQPEKIGGAVYINPTHSNTLDVVKRAIEEQGFEMIKCWCCTFADDPSLDPVMEYAEQAGVPVLFHSFKKSTVQVENETTGVHVANIARRHP